MAEHSPFWAQNQIPEGMDLTFTEIEINDDETGPSTSSALPLTSVVFGHQEAGSSSTVAAVANLPAPPKLTTQSNLLAYANPPVPINAPAPANPAAPVIDVETLRGRLNSPSGPTW